MTAYGPVKPRNMVLMAQDDGEELSTTHSDSDGTLSEDDYASDDVECQGSGMKSCLGSHRNHKYFYSAILWSSARRIF